MTPADVLAVSREAIWTMLLVGAPVLGLALAVGLGIALLQALTQMQEMTLSFVPKILAIFLSLAFLLPFMVGHLMDFGRGIMDRIVALS